MPLIKGAKPGTPGFKENVARERAAGKPEAQSVAIAYSESKDSESQRSEPDENGWFEIKGNPISKVGVFEYSGAQIDPSLDPNKIYNVYRPEEELNNPDTLESFKLVPWIDDHVMLGSEDEGLTEASKKGVHGVIGEDVFYEDGYLKGNLKVFSEKLSKFIKDGKKELSIGYRCVYDLVSGVYNGVRYDAIQRQIRGNHLALVDEGRAGHDVAVLDHARVDFFRCAFDVREFKMTEKMKDDKAPTLQDIHKMVLDLTEMVKTGMKAGNRAEDDDRETKGPEDITKKNEGDEMEEKGPEEKESDKPFLDAKEESPEMEKKAEDDDSDESKEENGGETKKPGEKAMDSQDRRIAQLERRIEQLSRTALDAKGVMYEVSKRDKLAERVSWLVGTFDHATKSHAEVIKYALDKLNLKAAKGQEEAMLEGFLKGREQSHVSAFAQDSMAAHSSDQIDAYIKGSN